MTEDKKKLERLEPDYSQATEEDLFGMLMAMRPGQPKEALNKAIEKLPKKRKETEEE